MLVRRSLAIVVSTLIAVTGCGADVADPGSETEITVFAAASLTDAFVELAAAYNDEHPDTSVTTNFAGSSELAAQILEGAPVDVFVSADIANMDKVTEVVDGDPFVFAANRAAIIVETGNPQGIEDVADLASSDLTVVTCAPEVPCGAYAATIFDRADVEVEPASYETNVKAVVTKVELGEADAGIVYETDVRAAREDTDSVEIPDDINVRAEYPIAVIDGATEPAVARDFVDFVRSDKAQTILASFGFSRP